jgi:hypothetical protein
MQKTRSADFSLDMYESLQAYDSTSCDNLQPTDDDDTYEDMHIKYCEPIDRKTHESMKNHRVSNIRNYDQTCGAYNRNRQTTNDVHPANEPAEELKRTSSNIDLRIKKDSFESTASNSLNSFRTQLNEFSSIKRLKFFDTTEKADKVSEFIKIKFEPLDL